MTPTVGGRLPDFIIGGAMRSGTTSLYRYLGAHPDVGMVPKELSFFTDHFDEGLDWYAGQFAAVSEQSILGEATADYFARQSAMTRIAQCLPEVRMVVSLRDPIRRAWSHYGLLSERGIEKRSFGTALDEEMARLAADGPNASGMFYLYHSLYDVHLERAIRLLGRDRLHVSIFERMAADPPRAYTELCEFIGVDAGFVPESLGDRVNPYVTFRSLRVRHLGKRLPATAGRLLARLNTRRLASAPQVSEVEEARLRDFFVPRIATVEDILGIRIPEWAPRAGGQ